MDWTGVCWCNPPYSETGKWIKKAYEESLRGATVVCLPSACTDTRWYHEYAVKGEIRFLKGRVKFTRPDGDDRYNATKETMVVIFRPPFDPKQRQFEETLSGDFLVIYE
jgi:DNA N-6-adenine-methyltransferase (Dam)